MSSLAAHVATDSQWILAQSSGSYQLILGGLFVVLPLSYHDHFSCPNQKVGWELTGCHISVMIMALINLSKIFKNKTKQNLIDWYERWWHILVSVKIYAYLVHPTFPIFSSCVYEVIFYWSIFIDTLLNLQRKTASLIRTPTSVFEVKV